MNSIKQKVYTSVLVSLGIIFAMFYFGFIHFAEKEKNLSLEIVSKKKEARQLKSQSEQIGEIRDAHQGWQEKTETVLESIVWYSELFDYVIEIRNLADENNVELETAVSSKGKGQINDDFSYTYYKIKATGHFSDVMKFLVCVENLKYYSEMENILFVADGGSSSKYDPADRSSEKISFSADLKIYLYHNDKPLNIK